MNKRMGYVVIEYCEDYTQILAVQRGPAFPAAGVLTWSDAANPSAIFPDRAAARSSIARTEHYRRAFNREGMPQAKDCRVEAVVAA